MYLKTFVTYGEADRAAVAEWLRGLRLPSDLACRIKVDVSLRSQAFMDALYHRADCYLSLSAAEGVGLGIATAAQLRCPVVTTVFGGQRDYISEDTAVVPHDRVPTQRYCGFGAAANETWARPRIETAVRLLRRVRSSSVRPAVPATPLAPADIRSAMVHLMGI